MTKYRHHPGHPLADKQGWVELNDEYYNHLPSSNNDCRYDGFKFNVISDTMEPTRHMADGNYYSSKSEFRAATKRAGCIEVGNDSSIMNAKPRNGVKPLDKRQRVEDIKRAIYETRNGIRR